MPGSASDSVDDFILTRTDPRWCNGVADWTVAVEASSSSDSHAPIRKPSIRRVSQKKTEAEKEADKLTRLLAMPSKFGRCSTHGTMLLPWLHKSGQHAGRIMLRCRLGKNLLLAILCTLNMCIFLGFIRFIRKGTFIAREILNTLCTTSLLPICRCMVLCACRRWFQFKKQNHERCWCCVDLQAEQWTKLPLKLREEYSRLEHALKRGRRNAR